MRGHDLLLGVVSILCRDPRGSSAGPGEMVGQDGGDRQGGVEVRDESGSSSTRTQRPGGVGVGVASATARPSECHGVSPRRGRRSCRSGNPAPSAPECRTPGPCPRTRPRTVPRVARRPRVCLAGRRCTSRQGRARWRYPPTGCRRTGSRGCCRSRHSGGVPTARGSHRRRPGRRAIACAGCSRRASSGSDVRRSGEVELPVDAERRGDPLTQQLVHGPPGRACGPARPTR